MTPVVPIEADYRAANLDPSFATASDAEKYRLAQAAALMRIAASTPMLRVVRDHDR